MTLVEALRALAPVDEASIARAVKDFVPVNLRAGDHFLRAGERATQLAYIDRGLVREYYVSPDGDEHVRSFCTEGMFTGSLYDLLSGEPSVVNIEALEPTRLLAAPWAAFQARCDREPLWHVAGRRHAEALYCRKAVREHQMLALSARERWEALPPDLVRRVSGRHLASYLGITPEHLSRIRQRSLSPGRGEGRGEGRARRAREKQSRRPR